MKEPYQPTKLEVIAFRAEDIITTSTPLDPSEDSGDYLPVLPPPPPTT